MRIRSMTARSSTRLSIKILSLMWTSTMRFTPPIRMPSHDPTLFELRGAFIQWWSLLIPTTVQKAQLLGPRVQVEELARRARASLRERGVQREKVPILKQKQHRRWGRPCACTAASPTIGPRTALVDINIVVGENYRLDDNDDLDMESDDKAVQDGGAASVQLVFVHAEANVDGAALGL